MDIVAVYHLSHSSSYTNEFTHKLGHDIRVDEVDKSVHSAQDTSTEVTTGAQENLDSEMPVGRPASSHGMSEKLNLCSDPIPNGNQSDFVPNLDVVSSNTSPDRKLANADNEVGYGGLSSECFYQLPTGESFADSTSSKALQLHDQDSSNIPVGGHFPQNNPSKFFSGYEDINFDDDLFFSDLLAFGSNDLSSGILSTEKDSYTPVLDVPNPDEEGSSAGTSGVTEQKNTSNVGTGCNKQPSQDIVENDDILLSPKADMLPDLNLNHFASSASTHSSHSVSIESLEDSIADARSNKVI